MSAGGGTILGAGGAAGLNSPSSAGGGGGGAAPDGLNPSIYIFDTKTATPVNVDPSVIIPGKTSSSFSDFLNNHGIWTTQASEDGYVDLQYTVSVPHTGWYSFVFGCLNFGTVYINGQDFFSVYDGESLIKDAYLKYGANTIYIRGYYSLPLVLGLAPVPQLGTIGLLIGYQANHDGGRGGDGYISIEWD
jgi:hypothetical protein